MKMLQIMLTILRLLLLLKQKRQLSLSAIRC